VTPECFVYELLLILIRVDAEFERFLHCIPPPIVL